MTIVIYNIVSIIIFFMLMYTYIHFSTYYKTKEFIMVSEVILFTYKSGEIDNFLNRFYSSSSFINNNSYIKLSFLNPLELSELIAAFSDNNTLFDIDMWISLDKDVFIKISPLNADIIIKYIFERYPY